MEKWSDWIIDCLLFLSRFRDRTQCADQSAANQRAARPENEVDGRRWRKIVKELAESVFFMVIDEKSCFILFVFFLLLPWHAVLAIKQNKIKVSLDAV